MVEQVCIALALVVQMLLMTEWLANFPLKPSQKQFYQMSYLYALNCLYMYYAKVCTYMHLTACTMQTTVQYFSEMQKIL